MLTKFLLLITAFFLVIQCRAANYYFAANGSDANTAAQAQNKTTPWQTITKLNSFFSSLKPGDSVLFRRGDTFTGTITVSVSGTAALPIIISAYGAGAQPIISGLVPVTGWTLVSGNIYQGSCPGAGSSVAIVMLNGVPQAIGRWPNLDAAKSGYLNVDSHVNDSQITSAGLNTAVNWAGAEVVIRKNHWIIDRGTISSNTATVINYSDISGYQPTNNFGFFIQNSPNTLDEQGEWYYNPTAKTLQMYLTSAPTNTSVQVSSTAYLVSSSGKNYITFNGLTFWGANTHIFNINNSTGFQIKSCVLNGAGQNGISALSTTRLVIDHTTIKYANNCAVRNMGASYSQFTNDTVRNAGAVAGMGQNGDGTYEGLVMNGKSALISNNYVANIGYDGIDFSQGDSTIVKNNYVGNFELAKDDGGGIYTYAAQVDSNTNFYGLQIVNNIVENTTGAINGTPASGPSYASGIYLDANCSGITVSGNSVANCLCGLFIHESRNIIITGNTLYNNNAQLFFSHNTTVFATKNNVTSGNIIYSQTASQTNLLMQTLNVGVQTFSSFSGNYYNSTINNTFLISANGKVLNLALWQYLYNRDLTSVDLPAIPRWNIIMPSKRSLFTNAPFASNTSGVLTWAANGNFLASWDNSGVLDGGSLKTYFSFQSGSASNNPMMEFKVGAVTTTNIYMVKFSLKATHSNRRVMAYLMNNAAPYNTVSPIQYLTLDSLRTENTIMMTPSVACANTIVVLRLENEDVTTWVDNFGFYTTSSTPVDPTTQIVYTNNPSTSNKTVKLAGTYYDAKGVIYKGQVTLTPYTSALLFKKADTTVTAPPVVYSAPNASKDYIAFNVVQKKSAANIGVYPNPASDYVMFNFNSSDVKDVNIKLLNTAGDVIMNQQVQVHDNNYRLDFTQKPKPGCYFIQLSGSGINQTSKVVII
jgi:parallel beta-helix repeat protein